MKTLLVVALCIYALAFLGGCSCCTFTDDASGNSLNTRKLQPSSIKQNLSYFDGSIDSVIMLDDSRFELEITLTSVRSGGSSESMAEPGQRVRAVPELSPMTDGSVELTEGRKARLQALRYAKSGTAVTGALALSNGKWILVDAGAK